jgi:hypothetical protein
VRLLLALMLLAAAMPGCASSGKVYCHQQGDITDWWPSPLSQMEPRFVSSLQHAGWTAGVDPGTSNLNASKILPNTVRLTADALSEQFQGTFGARLRLHVDASGYTRTPMPPDWPSLLAPTEAQLTRDLGAPQNRTVSDVGHVCTGVA